MTNGNWAQVQNSIMEGIMFKVLYMNEEYCQMVMHYSNNETINGVFRKNTIINKITIGTTHSKY